MMKKVVLVSGLTGAAIVGLALVASLYGNAVVVVENGGAAPLCGVMLTSSTFARVGNRLVPTDAVEQRRTIGRLEPGGRSWVLVLGGSDTYILRVEAVDCASVASSSYEVQGSVYEFECGHVSIGSRDGHAPVLSDCR